ncbi:MAG: hypothetical protein FWG85_01480 [Bacteroidetes bacterium]|nr:hypothetical protein [Bacteroidota bacterium]
MNIKRISLVVILLSIYIINVNAQDGGALQSRTNDNNLRFGLPNDIKTKLDNFFNDLVAKRYKKGLEDLLINSPISRKDEDFANILKELGKSIDYYGDIKGYEIVDFKTAGTSYHKVKILGLHQKFPTRWELNFYNSPDLGLIVTNVRYDDISNIYID